MKTQAIQADTLSPESCRHCGNPTPAGYASGFCCAGCETVFFWIQQQGLGRYYDLKTKGRPLRQAGLAVLESQTSFQYLDEPEVFALYSWETPEGRWMEFYLEGVHCAACVWLTEKVAEMVSHVRLIQLNLGSSVATVCIEPRGSFGSVASELQKMGYRPHPIKHGEEGDLQKKDNRLLLIRLGVAGASAGNIMLLAVSLYGGATGGLAEYFRWASFMLFLPVLVFSAAPFYQSAWAALRARTVSIDIPVVFGLLLGSVVSVVNLCMGDDRIYFDSLASLVFLLLATRYLLKRTQQAALNSSRMLHFITPSVVRKLNISSGEFESARLEQIKVGDHVQVFPNECFPADGLVIQGESSIDCALLSGESNPEKVGFGAIVFAGTVNLDSPLIVQVTQSGGKTRIGRILTSMESLLTHKAQIATFADRMSRYFVAAVILLSSFALLWGLNGNWHDGLNRALAVAIVTCPCTFALITPLAFSMTLGRLAKAGILVKGPDILEKLTQLRSVFLDKTGTLTYGIPRVTLWQAPEDLKASVLAIELFSTHPVAKALVSYLRPYVTGKPPEATCLKETLGTGIRAQVEGHWIELRRTEFSLGKIELGTEVSIFKEGLQVGRIVLAEEVRPDAEKTVRRLRMMGLTPRILSGDNLEPVLRTARAVGIPPADCFAGASPEVKGDILRRYEFEEGHTLMVGDGANDALALAHAHVGVAIHSGMEISLLAAGVYFRNPGVQPLCELLMIARETLGVVRRNFFFSIVYNLIAGAFALSGKIDPLLAAVLMPLSAFTVFLSSLAGTPGMRRAFRSLNG